MLDHSDTQQTFTYSKPTSDMLEQSVECVHH